jgi:hypothetical protein
MLGATELPATETASKPNARKSKELCYQGARGDVKPIPVEIRQCSSGFKVLLGITRIRWKQVAAAPPSPGNKSLFGIYNITLH